MIVYEEKQQTLKNGIIRKLIITKSVNESGELYKKLIQQPTNIVYGGEVVDVGYLDNGIPVFDNEYIYVESEENVDVNSTE